MCALTVKYLGRNKHRQETGDMSVIKTRHRKHNPEDHSGINSPRNEAIQSKLFFLNGPAGKIEIVTDKTQMVMTLWINSKLKDSLISGTLCFP